MSTVTLLSLPADVLRLIAAMRPGSAAVMVRLCRRLHALTSSIPPRFVEKDISPIEYWNHGLRFAQRRRLVELESPDEIITTEYVMVTPETTGLYTFTLYPDGRDASTIQRRRTSVYSTVLGTTGRCTHDGTSDTTIPKEGDYDETIADRVVSGMCRHVGGVLPSRGVIRDILEHRRDCNPDHEMVARFVRRGMRRLMGALGEPVLDHLLGLDEWTQEVVEDLSAMIRGMERDVPRCVRLYSTLTLLDGYARGGDLNSSPCNDLPFRIGTPDTVTIASHLGFALMRIGRYLGIPGTN